MGLGFQLDVLNNTPRQLQVSPGAFSNVDAGGFPTQTLNAGQWLSSFNQNQPFYVEIDGDTGSVAIGISAANQSQTVSGEYVLEFDTTSLTNFKGIPLFGSARDFIPLVIGNSAIFPVLYLGVFGQWTEAVVMFVEATGATTRIQPPYPS